ncbi:MAG: hypothetical protein V1798_00940 [Pseudomonadota bacterium]
MAFTVGIEHESDHQTIPYLIRDYYAVVLNDFVFRLDWTKAFERLGLTASLIEKAHFSTCTAALAICSDGSTGSFGFETGGELVAEWGAMAKTNGAIRPYSSVAATRLFARGKIRAEHRISVQTGLSVRRPRMGMWQLFGYFLDGYDVGIDRDQSAIEGGGGIAWSL